MSFCPNCGKEVDVDSVFCPSCGSRLNRLQKTPSPLPSQRKEMAVAKGRPNTMIYMLISIAGFGALALVSLVVRDALGFIIAAALGAALYFWGLKKLDIGDVLTSKRTFLIVGVLAGIIGLAVLLAGRFMGAIDILVAVPTFLAWHELEKS